MDNPVVAALLEIVDLLEFSRIEYVVMGGMAVRALALPRPTNDVDLTISYPAELIPELLKSFESEFIQVPEVYKNGWLDEVDGMRLLKLKTWIDREHNVDLDIFLSESEFQSSMLRRKIRMDVAGRTIWMVTPEDLVLLKLIADRPRDRIDVADVLFIQGELDRKYLIRWAASLGVIDRLESALSENK